MSIFQRIFKFAQAESHAVLDKIEDPIKLTEQGIRDLKNDLQAAMSSLADVKSMAINTRKQAEAAKSRAAEYEKKAMLLLQKAQFEDMNMAEAERLATMALEEKGRQDEEFTRLNAEAEQHEKMSAQLQSNVNKIKSTITKYENELRTLKARAKTAQATRKVNEQIAKVDTSGTVAMLERMKEKVAADESLAAAYADLAADNNSLENEIDAALGSTAKTDAQDKLAALKAKMGM
ncbi:PspA/IM30 family protein [Desulfovibrio mangrovi]|uniref:PspA/IM30 family protein n=1 Tax=Desulfovibrio mangrovi TaxID=2976983 RepID=UPI002245A3B6|nr:PspA/IM30 family protein [Desulfovibrio mangrovi]UZP65821.1 PspA/IM30 family protein [Desulfovibrio mangrovi]